VLNYFNYFTEIEQRFSARRGGILLLSTLDWALIETWREAGVPLEAVIRGIDNAFDKYDARIAKSSGRLRKVNGLAWCAQAVMQAAEEMREAAIGGIVTEPKAPQESGFEYERIAAYLTANAIALEAAALPEVTTIATRLRTMAVELLENQKADNESLETTLTALEQRLFAALTLSATEQESVTLREQASRELAPYRGKMSAVQLKQVTEQFLHKRLLDARGLPRLSLFYMSLG
jgi:hypothetical protein